MAWTKAEKNQEEEHINVSRIFKLFSRQASKTAILGTFRREVESLMNILLTTQEGVQLMKKEKRGRLQKKRTDFRMSIILILEEASP